jgi:hypothetical protein
MRISVRRVTSHRRVIEEVLASPHDFLASTEINVRTTLTRVIPRVTWFCDLIVPAKR